MPIPKARNGLVVRYEYVWHNKSRAQYSTPGKDRPACIAHVIAHPALGTAVALFPITHTQPAAETPAVEIPPKVKAYLGLDDRRSWVIVDEVNLDTWPSPSTRALPNAPGKFEYGMLPEKLLLQIRQAFAHALEQHRLRVVKREQDLSIR